MPWKFCGPCTESLFLELFLFILDSTALECLNHIRDRLGLGCGREVLGSFTPCLWEVSCTWSSVVGWKTSIFPLLIWNGEMTKILYLNVFHGTWYVRKFRNRYTSFHVPLSLFERLLPFGCYHHIKITYILLSVGKSRLDKQESALSGSVPL